MTPDECLINLIDAMGKISYDRMLDPHAVKMCVQFNPEKEDPVTFLLNLEDLFVRYAWADGTVMKAVSMFLDGHPTARRETSVQKARRRRELEPSDETCKMLKEAKDEEAKKSKQWSQNLMQKSYEIV